MLHPPSVLLLILIAAIVPDATVYHGRVAGAKKPAELVATTVFNEISEYKKIKEKKLESSDAEYWVLLNKANDKFNAAVKKVAERESYDVVTEKGTQKYEKAPPDITRDVIAALQN